MPPQFYRGGRTLINHDYEAYNGKLIKSTYGNGFYVENVYDDLERVVGRQGTVLCLDKK